MLVKNHDRGSRASAKTRRLITGRLFLASRAGAPTTFEVGYLAELRLASFLSQGDTYLEPVNSQEVLFLEISTIMSARRKIPGREEILQHFSQKQIDSQSDCVVGFALEYTQVHSDKSASVDRNACSFFPSE